MAVLCCSSLVPLQNVAEVSFQAPIEGCVSSVRSALDNRISESSESMYCSSQNYSPEHLIGRSDGRCVQRAGT